MHKPNVILISIDTLRADHLSCYGYQQKTTPNIDKIACEGTIFKQNYSTGVWTPPAHASMLTGLYVSEHGVYGERRLSSDIPTTAEKLREHGYQTIGLVNNSQVGELVGLDRGHETFIEVWKGEKPRSTLERIAKGVVRRARRKIGYEDMGASRTNRLFKEWIENHKDKNRPFYAFLHYIEPHNPLDPPRPYKNKHLDRNTILSADMNKVKKVAQNPLICFIEDIPLGNNEIEVLKGLYDAEIEYTDSKIGEIADILKRNQLYDETMIIITADHGEHFGEHGLWSHTASLHKEVLHIPLIIKYPRGVDYLKEVNEFTQLVDIFPTVMEIAGVSLDKLYTSGVSLMYGRDIENNYHNFIFAEWEGRIPYYIQSKAKESGRPVDFNKFTRQMATIQDKQYKYIWKSDGSVELYDITNGKEEIQDIAVNRDIIDHMHHELFRRKKPLEDAQKGATRSVDEEIAANLTALGYM